MKKPSRETVMFSLAAAVIIGAAATGIALQGSGKDVIVVYDRAVTISQAESREETVSTTASGKKARTSTAKTTTTKPVMTTAENSSTSPPETEAAVIISFPKDINLVTREELLTIGGVGESTADSILSYREQVGVIHNMDELLDIYGIGDGTVAMLREYLYVSDADWRDTETQTVTAPPEETEPVYEETRETSPPERQRVNINTADADEIEEKLLIDHELAENIIKVREQITYYSNSLEVLYAEGMTNSLYNEIKDYIDI